MSTIKNLYLIEPLFPAEVRDELDAAALEIKNENNCTFKILEVDDKSIVVRAKQEKHPEEKYLDKKKMVEQTRELFQRFIPSLKVHPQVIPFTPNPVDEVNASWIKKQMDKFGVRVVDLVQDTGVDKTNISAWANATRPMSQPVKAMFYFYFKFKDQQK